MDNDQEIILYVYSLYSSEEKLSYLQYTAALAIFFYLMEKGYLPNYQHQLLLYDYKDTRRYLWEDKKFMNDINIVRDHDFLSRSRVQTTDYRDINAHQCTKKGEEYLSNNKIGETGVFKQIYNELRCKCGNILKVRLNDDNPELYCEKGCTNITVDGFLDDIDLTIDENVSPSFI